MVLDPELLGRARAAAASQDEAERTALLARADYHTAVRRLHLAGGSLREVALALSLSHQRVQQIVRAAGGTWWRRVWRMRSTQRDAVCTWCQRSPAEVEKLIAGPDVYICDSCVGAAETVVAGGRIAGSPLVLAGPRQKTTRCAFCRRRADGDRRIVSAPSGHVCTDCLAVCRDIITASDEHARVTCVLASDPD